MRNAKTTIFGLLAAIGGYFAMNTSGKLQVIGQAVSGISTFLMGASAKDADNKIK
jgi:hypothetical protein